MIHLNRRHLLNLILNSNHELQLNSKIMLQSTRLFLVASEFMVASAFALSGCNPAAKAPDGGPDSATKADSGKQAQKILDQMAAAYREAKSYEDVGELATQCKKDGKVGRPDTWNFSFAFERPNKFRLQVYGVEAVCDGKDFHASLRQLPGQVLTLPAPATIDRKTFYADEQLNAALSQGGPVGAPLVPALLTDFEAAQDFFKGAQPPTLLAPEKVDGELCDRVVVEFKPPTGDKAANADAADEPSGKFVFYIDQKTHVLRRLTFPVPQEEIQELAKLGATEVVRVADFVGAKLNGQVPKEAFAFEMPKIAQAVKRLVPIAPPPTPPVNQLGKRIGDFRLSTTDGKFVTRDTENGKVVVLEFWKLAEFPFDKLLGSLQRIRAKYADDKRVAFYAVNADSDEVKNEDLNKLLKEWNCEIPLLRDRDAQGTKVFNLEGFPSRIVLGADGTMQDFEGGLSPDLEVELPKILNKVLANENTFDDVKLRFEVALKQYNDAIRKAQTDSPGVVLELPKVSIAAHSEPEKLKLIRLWKAADLKGAAGNILLVPQVEGSPDKGQKIFVIDGWRSVVELDTAGKLVARHDLLIPQDAVISFLRTAVDGDGKRYYVGFANNMPQLFLFDDKWNLLVSYPEGERVGIADVQIADLEGKGQPMLLVGYWDAVGVQGVSLTGKRLWGNRVMQNALHLGVSARHVAEAKNPVETKDTEPKDAVTKDAGEKDVEPKDAGEAKNPAEAKVAGTPEAASPRSGQRTLYCVNGSEAIGPLDHEGKLGQFISSPGVALEWVVADDLDGDGKNKLCVLSAHDSKATIAIGLDEKNHEQWSYPMVKGIPQKPVERIVPGKFADGRGAWLLAGPDGSIHILASDGKLIDRFQYGADLTGVALTVVGGKTVLLVASTQGLEAWEVAGPEVARAKQETTEN